MRSYRVYWSSSFGRWIISKWSEEELRRLAFDYVRGELSLDESEAIESRMAESQQFADSVKRLSALLHGAKEAPAESHLSIDADVLFGRIAEALHPTVIQVDPVLPQSDEADDDGASITRRRRWGLMTLAASLIGAVLAWVMVGQVTGRSSDVSGVATYTTLAQPAMGTHEALENVQKTTEAVAFETLKAQETTVSGVRVFANDSANYVLEGDIDRRLGIEAGTLLVEYLPQKGERLSVVCKGFKVQVTGTVFYVSDVNDGVVGVVTGSVLVIPDQGVPVAVRGGQEYLINEGLRAISPQHFEEATQHVTVEEHLDRLALVNAQPKVQPVEVLPRPKGVVSRMAESGRREQRDQAQIAMKERRYEDASSLMERLLEQVPASDPIAGATRLDLARIYLQRLNKPERAAFHLKRFVLARPSDAATPSATVEFCRITHESGRSDALCLP